MTTCKGWDSAARRMGTAKSVHASKNVETRNASFMDGPLRNFLLAEEHGSTGVLALCFARLNYRVQSSADPTPETPILASCRRPALQRSRSIRLRGSEKKRATTSPATAATMTVATKSNGTDQIGFPYFTKIAKNAKTT